MKLSVVIVNYNVKYFLEQCLYSVRKAAAFVPTEVFVVDNNSVDRSVEIVQEKFPEVVLVANRDNVGFSKANNQAIEMAKGDYILLLNPDTVVEEDTFEKIVRFMDEHDDAGGLGVKMIDGKGNFLPESKRGLPTPEVAFYKIFGLSALFPRSEKFGKYHLGNLDKDKIHEIDVLSGAFMLLRKTVIDKIGMLDEAFFMYGEDIDLSYRITKAGYKNYYYPETRIIHYKGESTKKSSVNYVFVFYNAMIIFAQKHFSQKNAKLFSYIINFAIYLRAFMAIVTRFVKRVFLPLTDAALLYGGIFLIKNYWESNIKSDLGLHYPPEFMSILVPIYIFIWIISVYFSGGYEKPITPSRILRGLLFGTGLILIFYSLLPELYRFSRAIVLLGSLWAVVSIMLSRFLLHLSGIHEFTLSTSLKRRMLIIGGKEEVKRVNELLQQTSVPTEFIGFVNSENKINNHTFIGNISQLDEMIQIHNIDEIIFCAKDISSQKIIDLMSKLGAFQVDYKIAPPESLYIIGSSSIDNKGDFYTIDINAISKANNQRSKRFLDIAASFVGLLLFPLSIFIVQNPVGFLRNIFVVMFGFKSWVGYFDPLNSVTKEALPAIKPSVLSPYLVLGQKHFDAELNQRLNLLYAKDYKLENDIKLILKGIKLLGNG